jgi:two-component SAPR family response regulator
MALTRAGHTAVVFENGVQAFDYLKNKENLADLLLTDIVMPEMDGVELPKNGCFAAQIARFVYYRVWINSPQSIARDSRYSPGVVKTCAFGQFDH